MLLLDFEDLDRLVNEAVLDNLDHINLNEVLDNPTVERVAAFIWRALATAGLPLV